MTTALRAWWQLARADTLERVRRPAFLVTLGVTVWFAYIALPPNHSHYVTMQLAGARGIYNSAWVGLVAALMTAPFLSIAGFYVVKNAVERDRTTGVGEILATTPVSRPLYTLGKAASNFAVLAMIVIVVVIAAGGMQLVRGEDRHLDLLALFGPAIVGTLPAMAVVAALAVLFETVPWLAGGLGNAAYFFLCTVVLWLPSMLALEHGRPGNDLLGTGTMMPGVFAAHARAFPADAATGQSFSMGFNFRKDAWDLKTFRWDGVAWHPAGVAVRGVWLLLATGIALVAAVPFDRFDPARRRRRETRPRGARRPGRDVTGTLAPPDIAPAAAYSGAAGIVAPPSATGYPSAAGLVVPARAPSLLRLARAEFRLLTAGVPKLWWLVALGLGVAQAFAPLEVARGVLLSVAWVWPLLLWSQLGSRDERHGTAPLLMSSPHPLARQLPAQWLAGAGLAVLLGAPVALRLVIAGDGPGIAAWSTGAAFAPSLAIALGTWSGGGTLFEVLYLALWYMGPMNRVPFLDFLGYSRASARGGAWIGFAAAAAVLVALAALGRRRRLHR